MIGDNGIVNGHVRYKMMKRREIKRVAEKKSDLRELQMLYTSVSL